MKLAYSFKHSDKSKFKTILIHAHKFKHKVKRGYWEELINNSAEAGKHWVVINSMEGNGTVIQDGVKLDDNKRKVPTVESTVDETTNVFKDFYVDKFKAQENVNLDNY